jgi:hypothetical protein
MVPRLTTNGMPTPADSPHVYRAHFAAGEGMKI